MNPIRKLSMNTSLKNARIFDDDAWDDDGDTPKRKLTIKQEPCETTTTSLPTTPNPITKVKYEPEEDEDEFEERPNFKCDISIKKEKKCESLEEGELEDTFCESISDSDKLVRNLTKHELKSETSPAAIKLKLESDGPVDRMFDESPYNNKLLESWKIKDHTPVKTETEGPSPRCSLKSAKRTVFNRHSPYKKTECDTPEKRISAKSRLGTIVDSDEEGGHPAKRAKIRPKQDMESNPEVLTRREKQIEYGKNTIGYENYLQMVPRDERKREDPKTPPKYGKYSRRGWEGLIKQWRIKLHKYDPPEDNA